MRLRHKDRNFKRTHENTSDWQDQMIKDLNVASVKIFLTMGMAVGGIAAWAMDHFETKEHAASAKDSRDREYDHLDRRFDILDHKVDILLERKD